MSWITQLAHGQISPAQFLGKAVGEMRSAVGDAVVREGAAFVVDNADHYKATIEDATRAYLEARLGTEPGDLAANVADIAINALAAAVEVAAQAVATQTAA